MYLIVCMSVAGEYYGLWIGSHRPFAIAKVQLFIETGSYFFTDMAD